MSFPTLTIGDLIAKLPIVQGGMGVGISLSSLASAVANQGGIGVIAGAMIGMREPDIAKNPVEANVRALKTEILKARELSPMDLPKILLDTCEEKKEQFKTKLVPIVSSARAASVIAKKWQSRTGLLPDAFVVEGPKAGGHLGYKYEEITDKDHTLEHIVPEVVETVKGLEDQKGQPIPVIAAGGIYSGEDIANIMELGASGVQMGTRFVATNECDADIKFKEAFVNAKEEDITIIKSPVGMPGRALFNNFIKAVREGKKRPVSCAFHCVSTCQQEKTPYCIASALIAAMHGNLEKGFAFCGTNVSKIKSIISVRELMETLQTEYDNFKAKL